MGSIPGLGLQDLQLQLLQRCPCMPAVLLEPAVDRRELIVMTELRHPALEPAPRLSVTVAIQARTDLCKRFQAQVLFLHLGRQAMGVHPIRPAEIVVILVLRIPLVGVDAPVLANILVSLVPSSHTRGVVPHGSVPLIGVHPPVRAHILVSLVP